MNRTLMMIFPLLLTQSCQFNSEGKSPSYEGHIYVTSRLSSDPNSTEMKEFLPEQRLILYKHYVIETSITNDLIDLMAKKIDTTGYFFIDLEKQVYTKYNALSENAKELEHGNLANKKVGLTFYAKEGDMFDNASDLKITDTLISNERIKTATAIKKDSTQTYNVKAWVTATPGNFPIQLSRSLSEKTGGGFVNKMQLSVPDVDQVMISSLQYKENKLPDSTLRLIEKWSSQLTTK